MRLAICIAVLLVALVISVSARRGIIVDAKNLLTGNRSFGGLLVFFLGVGDAYSINAMLGYPGGIFRGGANFAVWYLGYSILAFTVGFFLAPAIWKAGRAWDCMTIADLYKARFNSRGLAAIVAVSAVLFLIAYAQISFLGLGVVASHLGVSIDYRVSMILAALIAFVYVTVAGLKGSAWISIFKDFAMVLTIVVVGVVAIYKSGGVATIFQQTLVQKQEFLTVQSGSSTTFTLSTMVFQSFGWFVIPFLVQSSFAAKSASSLRKAISWMPIYMYMNPFIIAASYYAVNSISLGSMKSADNAFIAVAENLLPETVLGIIIGSMAIAGTFIIGSVGVCIGGLVGKNILRDFLAPQWSDHRLGIAIKIATASALIIAATLTIAIPQLMLNVINIAYYGFTQFFPGILAILAWKRATKWGVGVGLVAGDVVSFGVKLMGINLYGLNPGIIGLSMNISLLIIVSLITKTDEESLLSFEKLKVRYPREVRTPYSSVKPIGVRSARLDVDDLAQ